jgi:hypothetical protein
MFEYDSRPVRGEDATAGGKEGVEVGAEVEVDVDVSLIRDMLNEEAEMSSREEEIAVYPPLS